jgi:hypothetical protein
MLFWHIPSLRIAHPRVWDDLQYAWRATFRTELSDTVLEKWTTTGPHAFSADQSQWLTETAPQDLEARAIVASARHPSLPSVCACTSCRWKIKEAQESPGS